MSVAPVKAQAPGTGAPLVPNAFNIGLCGGCGKSSGCAGCCCPCCVVGANAKMIETGVVVGPMDGCGGICFAHALIGGVVQGFAIFMLGPLAGLVHAGSLIGCCVRHDLREKYEIPGNRVFDCCIHYCCGPCATCQEYEELTMRLSSPMPSS